MNNKRLLRWVVVLLLATVVLTSCGLGQFLSPQPTPTPTALPDPRVILEANGIKFDFTDEHGIAYYETEDQDLSVEITSVEIRFNLVPREDSYLVNQIRLQAVLTAMYPSDLVKAIMDAQNTSLGGKLMATDGGTVGGYSWSLSKIRNPGSPSSNRDSIIISNK